MAKFIEKESFKHKFAKELLASWLVNAEKEQQDFIKFCGLSWRKNYGVYTELKFHETDDHCYFECSQGIINDEKRLEEIHTKTQDYLSVFDPNFDRGKCLFIPDITIFHKGSPKIIIEVVHTHALTNKKIERMKKFFPYIQLYEITAEEILCKTEVPSTLNFKSFLD